MEHVLALQLFKRNVLNFRLKDLFVKVQGLKMFVCISHIIIFVIYVWSFLSDTKVTTVFGIMNLGTVNIWHVMVDFFSVFATAMFMCK